MAILAYINPFRVVRDFVTVPIESFVSKQVTGYKKKTNDSIESIKELIYKAGVIAVFFAAILWVSIFMYVIFYYTYMPNVTHVRPVHLQFNQTMYTTIEGPVNGIIALHAKFKQKKDGSNSGMVHYEQRRSCEESMGVCSFPSAHVQLTRRSSMLMSSQPYRVRLALDMPESQVNKDLGMFMVCAQMRAKGGVLVSASCRSAILRHRSMLHQVIRTLVMAPLLLSGFDEEKQTLQVELFSDFEDDQELPVTDAYVEVQSRFVQVNSCELLIEAHFTGLRYYMFNWPKISTLIGISTNLFFVSLVFFLSWYHLQDGLPDFIKNKLGLVDVKAEKDNEITLSSKVKLEREDSFPFLEDETLIEEYQKMEKKKT